MDITETDRCLSMLDDIDESGSGLTDWEAEFIDSMLKKGEAGDPFTLRERDKIEQIFTDRV